MTHNIQRIVLFANGDLPLPNRLKSQLNEDDFLIAVDGGLHYLTALDLKPNLIIGDLDSADRYEVDRFIRQGVEVRRFPPEKDETDLELALDAALEMTPSVIWIAAALGKRLDQTLGNIFLLTQSRLAEVDIRLVDGARQVLLIRDAALITGKPGQRLSLIPLNAPVTGVKTEGLQYPLVDETLYPDKTRGISNCLTDTSAEVTIQNGLLLCIHQTTLSSEGSD